MKGQDLAITQAPGIAGVVHKPRQGVRVPILAAETAVQRTDPQGIGAIYQQHGYRIAAEAAGIGGMALIRCNRLLYRIQASQTADVGADT